MKNLITKKSAIKVLSQAAIIALLSTTHSVTLAKEDLKPMSSQDTQGSSIKAESFMKDDKAFLKLTAKEDVRNVKVTISYKDGSKEEKMIVSLKSGESKEYEVKDIEVKKIELPKTNAWVKDMQLFSNLKTSKGSFSVRIEFEKMEKGSVTKQDNKEENKQQNTNISTQPKQKQPRTQPNTQPSTEQLSANKLNTEMLKLVNAERTRLGKKTLKYLATLQKGVEIRAKEITKKFSHDRPDETSYETEFKNLWSSTIGENISQNNVSENQKTDAKHIASILYKQWEKSPGHYANMINDQFENIAFAVEFDGYKVYGVQIFTA